MKIGVLIPTRGDRPELLKHALKQMEQQTRKPDLIEIVDDAPLNKDKDITWRYRIGCERILRKEADAVFLIEDDDWYSNDFIERMLSAWEFAGHPEIFGIGETIYYHLGLKSYCLQSHSGRASAFCTMITKEGISKMKWPNDNYPFTDIEFWKSISGKTFIPGKTIAIGMKGHKTGSLFGGMGHNENTSMYKNNDHDLNWLKSKIDTDSFEFYKKYLTQ